MSSWEVSNHCQVLKDVESDLLFWRLNNFDPLVIKVFAKLSDLSGRRNMLPEENLASCDFLATTLLLLFVSEEFELGDV